MPKQTFLELDNEKRERIIETALKEFAAYGYAGSSTNRIVKESGISKGSLFKYFENKEDMYFYLIDTVASEMAVDMENDLNFLPEDLKERVIAYSLTEISWYMANPVKGHFMISVASEKDEISKKLIERYGEKGNDVYKDLLKGAKPGRKGKEEAVSDVLLWVLKGFNEKFLKENDCTKLPLAKLKEEYTSQLSDYLDILFNGVCRENSL